MKTGFLGVLGSKKDTIDYCTTEIIKENRNIIEKSEASEYLPATNSVFVVFDGVKPAHEFVYKANTRSAKKSAKYHIRYLDVDTDDVIWKNLNRTRKMYIGRRIISALLTALMVLFWIVPTAVIAAFANLTNLQNLAPFEWIGILPTVVLGVLKGILPVVVLSILTMLVPIILRMFIRIEKPALSSQIELKLCDRFFYFQLFNNFFIYLLIGSVVSSLGAFISKPHAFIVDFFKDPVNVLEAISKSVPANSTFFTTYILLLGLSAASGAILQIFGLIKRWIFGFLLSYTPRKTLQTNSPVHFIIGEALPLFSFVFLLGLTFSVIAPIMTLATLLFFALFSLAYRYNFVYVYDTHSYNHGSYSTIKHLSHRWAALYCFQVIMIFLLAVNTQSSNAASSIVRLSLMAVTLVITIAYHIYFKVSIYKRLYYLDSTAHCRDNKGCLAKNTSKRIDRDVRNPNHFTKEKYDEIYKDGYVLLADRNYKNQFNSPCFRDPAHTTVWVPKSEEPETQELYTHVNNELGDYGIVTDTDVVFKDNLRLRVETDKAPDYSRAEIQQIQSLIPQD